jgi:hypothetical protein
MGITSRGDTGLRESRRRSDAVPGRVSRSCGEAGGVDGLLKGSVTSSATDDGDEELEPI